jgi:hypothetical protein
MRIPQSAQAFAVEGLAAVRSALRELSEFNGGGGAGSAERLEAAGARLGLASTWFSAGEARIIGKGRKVIAVREAMSGAAKITTEELGNVRSVKAELGASSGGTERAVMLAPLQDLVASLTQILE